MIKKLFGERIAVSEVHEEFTGSIVIPQGFASAGRDYRIGTVIAVPDGVMWNGEQRELYLQVGQTVLFQIPQKITEGATFRIPGFNLDKPFSLIIQTDVIGILHDGNKVNLDTFEIACHWVLGDIFTNEVSSIIAIPDTAVKRLHDFRIRVLQKGKGVTTSDYERGDEVFPERTKCNPIFLDNKEYLFVDKNNIFGVAAEKPAIPFPEVEVDETPSMIIH